MKLLIITFAILLALTAAAKVEKKVNKKLDLSKEKRESPTGSYLPPSKGYLPPSGSGISHGIGSSHSAGTSFGGGHSPISFSHGGGAGIRGGLGAGGHGPAVDTYIIEQVGGHGGGIGGGRGYFGGGAGFGQGHSKFITPNIGSYKLQGHGGSLGYNGGYSLGGLSSIGGGYSGRHFGSNSNGLAGSGYAYSSGGFGGNHGGISSFGGLGGHGGNIQTTYGTPYVGGQGGYESSFSGGHSGGIQNTYGVPAVVSHGAGSFGGLGGNQGVSYQNYDHFSGGQGSGGSFGGSHLSHSGSLGESQFGLGVGGAQQSYIIPSGSYGIPLAPPLNAYAPSHASAVSFGSSHDGGVSAISSAGNTFGYEAPGYATGHKGLRHYHSGENQHAFVESKPIALTGTAGLHTHIAPSQAPFKPSAFLGATHESSGLSHGHGSSGIQQQYRIETQDYAAPAAEYGAPTGSGYAGGSYENVNGGYTGQGVDGYSQGGSYSQNAGYETNGNHGAPSGSYLPPSSGLPANSYLPPSSSYGVPSSSGHH